MNLVVCRSFLNLQNVYFNRCLQSECVHPYNRNTAKHVILYVFILRYKMLCL